jgi:hypothetical protein
VAQSRKRRKERQRAAAPKPQRVKRSDPLSADDSRGLTPSENGGSSETEEPSPRSYARGRAKDEAARAALKPLVPGERPTAVTVGAIAAVVLAAANIVAMIAGWNDLTGDIDQGRAVALTLLWSGLLLLIAWGMWRARYWAVLGMQTLLAIALILGALSLAGAGSVGAALILLVILAATGTLFWFMVKAMARIQMPERPSRAR